MGAQDFKYLNKFRVMYLVDVAVPAPLPQTFTYCFDREVPVGVRVVVPFGGQQLIGVALGVGKPSDGKFEIKEIRSVVDETPVYSRILIDLALWMSAYYMHPLGEVLRAMLPASSARRVRNTYTLSAKGKRLRDNPCSPEGALLALLFKKVDSLSEVVIKARLKKQKDAVPFRTLVAKRWLTKASEKTQRAREIEQAPQGANEGDWSLGTSPDLTLRQRQVLATIQSDGLRSPQSRVFLLHGVTGSGKTEIYLNLIASLLRTDANQQALVLVPEISLTPQMTRVFEQRFPSLVAVVHSAMGDMERWAQLERIRRGEARILIGPRSAVFGPFKCLRLLIVDEEHDASYKQSTGLMYNGRDIAVVRGKMEGATVVLGSATPSMESYHNAITGRYTLLELPERANSRPLPSVELLEISPQKRHGQVVHSSVTHKTEPVAQEISDESDELLLAPAVVDALRDNLARQHQSIVLVNRRGYAYYLFSLQEKKAIECPYCSISMTLHARSTILRCHYCDHRVTLAQVVAGRERETFVAVGYGSQRAEDLLQRKVPGARIARLDSDVVIDREALPQTLAQFRAGQIDLLVGTQMLAKGHDFPNVTLIAILEIDQALNLPDFRSGERTFQLVVQAAGRAGRADLPGRVLIQTQRASHPVIAAAIGQDYRSFAGRELEFRRRHLYPPFSRMIAIELSSLDGEEIAQMTRKIENWLEELARIRPKLLAKVRVLGPAVPPIERVRGRYRRSLVFSAEQIDGMRQVVTMFVQAFARLPGDVRLRVDVDPQSLI